MTTKIQANGWNYQVETDSQGTITRIGCERRFPLTAPKWIGDEWLVADLQRRVDAIRAESAD
jgi:hypothetical protein